MNTQSIIDLAIFMVVMIFASLIAGLKSWQASSAKPEAVIVGLIAALTVAFVMIATSLLLRSLLPLVQAAIGATWPALRGITIPNYGIAGAAGIVAHLGLDRTAALIRNLVARR